jgi:phospholipid/cholesterol/gamma-HCH transport system substrate-binding protein
METRANYVVIGLFTLAVIAGAFAFVNWFSNLGSTTARSPYKITFQNNVSGLRAGSAVLFNGIRVGEVSELRLNAADPKQVMVVLAVDRNTPIRSDTSVGLEFQGLTGIASVALRGGSPQSPLPAKDADGVPVLAADPSATQDVVQAAREALRQLTAMVSDNQEALHNSLANLEVFTNSLRDNADRLDRVMAGVENLSGGPDKPGELAEAARSVRAAADNLQKRTNEISAGLTRFTGSGLREWSQLATDGRRTLSQVDRTVRNLDRNPQRLIFGGGSSIPDYNGRH